MESLEKMFSSMVTAELGDRHTYYARVAVVEPSLTTEHAVAEFADALSREAVGITEHVKHELKRSGSAPISANVEHSVSVEKREGRDPATGDAVVVEERVHRFNVTFECTGNQTRKPRAKVLGQLSEWLMVDAVEYINPGQVVATSEGHRYVRAVDTAFKAVRLNKRLTTTLHELYCVGDAGAPEAEAKLGE